MSANRQGLFGRFEQVVEKYCPDPLLFAVFLTLVMLALVLVFTDAGPGAALSAWGNGLHGLLAFTMQMCLMVVTAHVLAHTGPVEKLLQAVGRAPNNAWQAYLIVILSAAAFSLACWPLGLIAGGLIAREVAATAHRRNIPISYPLLAAAALGGFVVWEMGYSSSVGLTYPHRGRKSQSQHRATRWNRPLQGPVFIQAAQALDVKLNLITMSIAWGDQVDQPYPTVLRNSHTGYYGSQIAGNLRFLLRHLRRDCFPVYAGVVAGAITRG